MTGDPLRGAEVETADGPAPPPHTNLEAEVEVLRELAAPVGYGMDGPEPEVIDALAALTPDHFATGECRRAFKAIAATLDDHGRPDGPAAQQELHLPDQVWFHQNVIGKWHSALVLPARVKTLDRLRRRRSFVEALAEAGTRLDDGDEAGFHAALHGIEPEADANDLIEPPFGAAQPEPVLWRQPQDPKPDWKDPLLAVGEVAVLSGPGKAGKSTVALALAHAMGAAGNGHQDACGIRCAAGNVVLLGYEDAPVVVASRMQWYGQPAQWAHVRIFDSTEPLWAADPDDPRTSRPTPLWGRFWAAVGAWSARLVVIDPASVVFAGASNDAAQVRGFIAALRREALEAECGVLVLAHDTKSARTETYHGNGPGAGAVQGSSQWTDGTRGLLHLARLPKDRREHYAPKSALLQCVHSNYGPSDWGMVLEPQLTPDGRWQGIGARPVEHIDDVTDWTTKAARAAAEARKQERALQEAQAFADWIGPLRRQDAHTTYADLRSSFEEHTGTPVTAKRFTSLLEAHNIERKRRKIGGKPTLCAIGIAL